MIPNSEMKIIPVVSEGFNDVVGSIHSYIPRDESVMRTDSEIYRLDL